MPGAFRDQTLPHIPALPSDILLPEFLLEEEGRFSLYSIPFERLNPGAMLVIVGLTPGLSQMQEAFMAARQALNRGVTREEAVAHVDRAASFAGTMRTNMIRMLDGIGLPEAMGISSARDLFANSDLLVHTTSALRYPVFKDGKNYGGSGPSVEASPLLSKYLIATLAPELEAVPEALILPLGVAVEGCLRALIRLGKLDQDRCLFGFPHPSGRNGRRARQFRENEAFLRNEIERWAERLRPAPSVQCPDRQEP